MATINKKLIHFSRYSDFVARLDAGDIPNHSIVFIKDAKKIWTHGEFYNCNIDDLLSEYNEQVVQPVVDKVNGISEGANLVEVGVEGTSLIITTK